MKHLLLTILAAIAITTFTACSTETGQADGPHTCRMIFNGDMPSYDEAGSRATSISFVNGMTLYINFGSIIGTATYNSSMAEWSLNYSGSLSRGTASCSVYYIDDGGAVSNNSVALTSSSAVYGTRSGSYTVSSDGSITVTAALAPMLSRVRFKGTNGTAISVDGAKTASAFSLATGSFSSSAQTVSLSVASDGYTPYVYYTEPSSTVLTIVNNGNTFTMTNPLTSDITNNYCNIPTASSHGGWAMNGESGGTSDGGNNGHEAVDLGLSVKWATMNVGASSPEDYGDYFAWGETTGYNSGKTDFSWSTYKYCNGNSTSFTKYCILPSSGTVDSKTTLELSDDAAYANWGGTWRMPTYDELMELCASCTWTWTTQNGVNGYKVTGTNGNSIFLPAAGYREKTDLKFSESYYWSSSLNYLSSSSSAWYVFFYSSNVGRSYGSRYRGQSVRPVCP